MKIGWRGVVGILLSAGFLYFAFRGIRIDDRLAVIYSREDLSGGLVGQSVDGIVGYDPQSAAELMRRLILAARP